jgi:hypothetical protein
VSAAQKSTAPSSESRVKAADPMAQTGELCHDGFTYDAPEQASLASLFAAALAPGEFAPAPLAFASEALLQISADMVALETALFTDGSQGPINPLLAHRVFNGISSRARVASEVLDRMVAARNSAPAVSTRTQAPPARSIEAPIAEIRDLLTVAIAGTIDLTPDGEHQLSARDQVEKGSLVLHHLRAVQEELTLLERAVHE